MKYFMIDGCSIHNIEKQEYVTNFVSLRFEKKRGLREMHQKS